MELFTAYPEFSAAAAICMVFIFLHSKNGAKSTLPSAWLMEPAISIVSLFPVQYVNCLLTLLNYSGYRNNQSFGLLSSMKVYSFLLAGAVLSTFLHPAITIASAVALFFTPDLFIFLKMKRRQRDIREALPQALDLMVLCVDAGLGLDATIRRIASENTVVSNALNEELLTLGRDILLGMSRQRAYQELYNRTGVEELRALTSALNQSTKLGLSIARILRGQADFLRTKLAQKAEEKSAKLPIYMAFPLWFCVMPALMVILLAPSIITFMQNAPTSISSGVGAGL
ncbi:MAG: hypothetical protein DKT66_24235 [Candidatus Melainabacteria bacterium]|nr:MAG: hypothetical protein DKT66_24235 [Candidatus Melainabacteria bacterium]